jgi:hypothetical protein
MRPKKCVRKSASEKVRPKKCGRKRVAFRPLASMYIKLSKLSFQVFSNKSCLPGKNKHGLDAAPQ